MFLEILKNDKGELFEKTAVLNNCAKSFLWLLEVS